LRGAFAHRVLFIGLAMSCGTTAWADSLSGRWYAEGVEDGQHLQWIEDNRDDGTFTIAIRFINGCDVSQAETETGSWHYADHRLTKWTRTVKYRRVPDADNYHDTWLATPVDGDHVQLLDIKTHVTWAASRVARDFVFPDPSHCESS
jgi:hypothetical protein